MFAFVDWIFGKTLAFFFVLALLVTCSGCDDGKPVPLVNVDTNAAAADAVTELVWASMQMPVVEPANPSVPLPDPQPDGAGEDLGEPYVDPNNVPRFRDPDQPQTAVEPRTVAEPEIVPAAFPVEVNCARGNCPANAGPSSSYPMPSDAIVETPARGYQVQMEVFGSRREMKQAAKAAKKMARSCGRNGCS